MRHLVSVMLISLTLSVLLLDQTTSSATSSGAPDKAYLQKIWDGWSTLDPRNVAQFYASGAHVFFDIAPLKYTSWEEYEKNVSNELADYKLARFTVNDDAELHPAGNYLWGSATVKDEMRRKSGKSRWVIFAGPWCLKNKAASGQSCTSTYRCQSSKAAGSEVCQQVGGGRQSCGRTPSNPPGGAAVKRGRQAF